MNKKSAWIEIRYFKSCFGKLTFLALLTLCKHYTSQHCSLAITWRFMIPLTRCWQYFIKMYSENLPKLHGCLNWELNCERHENKRCKCCCLPQGSQIYYTFRLFIAYLEFLGNFTYDATMLQFPPHTSVQAGYLSSVANVPSGQQTLLPLAAIFLIAAH